VKCTVGLSQATKVDCTVAADREWAGVDPVKLGAVVFVPLPGPRRP
jgi:hypothetical protein